MQVEQLSDVFVASGVNMVNGSTFTALFHGYNLRGKIVAPTVPVVDFIFYGNIHYGTEEAFSEFYNDFSEKFGRIPVKMDDNAVRILVELKDKEPSQVKELLGAVAGFMMANNIAVINIPPEPDPVPEPEPQPAVQQPTQQQPIQQPVVQSQRAEPRNEHPVPQPPQEPAVPFEDHMILEKLTKIFIMGLNKVSNNTFTTVFHGYNIYAKMMSPTNSVVDFIFYGQPLQVENIAEKFNSFVAEMTEKYGNFPIRGVGGGNLEVMLDFKDKNPDECKAMLGEVSGFMIKNDIVCVSFPSNVPTGVPYNPNGAEQPQQSPAGQSSSYSQTRTPTTGYSQPSPTPTSGVGKFFKKFGKKT